jgi:hypothetical protein
LRCVEVLPGVHRDVVEVLVEFAEAGDDAGHVGCGFAGAGLLELVDGGFEELVQPGEDAVRVGRGEEDQLGDLAGRSGVKPVGPGGDRRPHHVGYGAFLD